LHDRHFSAASSFQIGVSRGRRIELIGMLARLTDDTWEGSAMQYPHWLMVAGAVLVVLGFIGSALGQNKNVEPDHEPTEMKAKGK
jgi:hypothetical protein